MSSRLFEVMKGDWGQSAFYSGEMICIGDGEDRLYLYPSEVMTLLRGLHECGLLTGAPTSGLPVVVSECNGSSAIGVQAYRRDDQVVWQYKVCEPDDQRAIEGKVCLGGQDGYLLTIARLFILLRSKEWGLVGDLAIQFYYAESVRILCDRDDRWTARIIDRAAKLAA